MGLYRRGKTWWMAFTADGQKRCESTGTSNKRLAQKILDIRRAEIVEGRYASLVKSHAPTLKDWATQFLKCIQHPNTRRRYESSKANLIAFFGHARLAHVTAARIEEYKQARLAAGVKGATINRDLRLLAQLLKRAERERYIARSPFDTVDLFLNESRDRRQPHILTWEEQKKLLAVAPPGIRLLTVLGTETGMRTGEMLRLRWQDISFEDDTLHVQRSKTPAGIRTVAISGLCKAELVRWRNLVGPEFSEWVFPSFSTTRHPLQGGRKSWTSALKKAGIPYFPIINLRHTFASRLTAAGVSPITIAQMLGHSSTGIVQTYAKVLDQSRRDAIRKLETLRQASAGTVPVAPATSRNIM